MSEPTVEQRAQWQRLSDEATAGPWRAYCRDVANPTNDPFWPRENFLQFEIEGPEPPTGRGDFYGPDAGFIAASREAVPALLAALERAEARIKEMEGALLYLGSFENWIPEDVREEMFRRSGMGES